MPLSSLRYTSHYCCSKVEFSSLSPYLSCYLPPHQTRAPTHTHPPSFLPQGIFRKCIVMHYIFRMVTYRDSTSMSTNRLTLLLVWHSFVHRMQQQVCWKYKHWCVAVPAGPYKHCCTAENMTEQGQTCGCPPTDHVADTSEILANVLNSLADRLSNRE